MRYVTHPGFVRSANDGDTHSISSARLLELYRIPLGTKYVDAGALHGFEPLIGDVNLTVRPRGDYSLPRPLDTDDLT